MKNEFRGIAKWGKANDISVYSFKKHSTMIFLLSMKDVMLAQMKCKEFSPLFQLFIAKKVKSNEMEITKHNSLLLK